MAAKELIRILSVEDHPVFRAGLVAVIASEPDMTMVAQATNAQDAVAQFRLHRPDVTLMDMRLPGENGTDALIAIRKEFSGASIIILTSSHSDAEIKRAMRAGAAGYILKTTPPEDILSVIRSVHAGQKYIGPEVIADFGRNFGGGSLTVRELEVLGLIRDGHRNKQIAGILSISETTVNFHIKNLVEKLGANDKTHALTIALRRGLLEA